MENRRQAFRREPIIVELSADFMVVVDPIPWEKRTEFGNEVVQQSITLLNEAVKIYVDDESGLPRLEAKLSQKFSNYDKLFSLGLSATTYSSLKDRPLYSNQIVEILLAICDINDLKQLRPMLDPNSQTPTPLGGILSTLTAPGDDTPKIESGPDSSPVDSQEKSSEPSPTLSSMPS